MTLSTVFTKSHRRMIWNRNGHWDFKVCTNIHEKVSLKFSKTINIIQVLWYIAVSCDSSCKWLCWCPHIQYWSLLNWRKMRFRCGFVAVPVNWNFVVISGSKLCATFLNIANYFKTLRCGCGAIAVRLRLIFQFT